MVKSVHERLMRFTRVACKLFFLVRSFTSPILWLIKKTFVNGRILDSKICNYEMLFAHTKIIASALILTRLFAQSLAVEEDMQTRTNPESNHERDRYEHEERKKN